MTDEACDEGTEEEIRAFISSCEGVRKVDSLLTRKFGNRIYVIAEIACDGNLSLTEAHAIAEAVHNGIEENFSAVKHITIHVNPFNETEENVNEDMYS